MKPSIAVKLAQLSDRLAEVNRLLSSEEATADMDAFRRLSREHAELQPVVSLYDAYLRNKAEIASAQEMTADPEMKELAEAEVREGKERLLAIEAELQRLLLPRDPNDELNIFLEIRAGTGGDESALFAGDLFRMYARYAERKRWQVEVVSQSPGEVGGYKEI